MIRLGATSTVPTLIASGEAGADTFIIEPGLGNSATIVTDFRQSEGDKLDLSALRTLGGGVVTLQDVKSAAAQAVSGISISLTQFRDSHGGQLQGSISLPFVNSAADLVASDFIFTSTSDWHTSIPNEFLGLI